MKLSRFLYIFVIFSGLIFTNLRATNEDREFLAASSIVAVMKPQDAVEPISPADRYQMAFNFKLFWAACKEEVKERYGNNELEPEIYRRHLAQLAYWYFFPDQKEHEQDPETLAVYQEILRDPVGQVLQMIPPVGQELADQQREDPFIAEYAPWATVQQKRQQFARQVKSVLFAPKPWHLKLLRPDEYMTHYRCFFK